MIVLETNRSRATMDAFEGSTGKLTYVCQLEGAETETELIDFISGDAPLTYTSGTGTSYKRHSISVTPQEAGNGLCDVEITYTQPKPLQLSFQTGGGSEKIEYSRETIAWFDEFGQDNDGVPDFQGGINVTKDSVEGVSIKTAQFSFKITKSWDIADLPPDYVRTLERLTTCVNDDLVTLDIGGVLMEFESGELMFDGADGQTTSDGRLEFVYSFSVSRNITPADADSHRYVGPILITDKRGWDLIWIYSVQSRDNPSNTTIRSPVAAYVEQVYDYKSFDDLELS